MNGDGRPTIERSETEEEDSSLDEENPTEEMLQEEERFRGNRIVRRMIRRESWRSYWVGFENGAHWRAENPTPDMPCILDNFKNFLATA